MLSASLIVCERTPRWVVAFRSALNGSRTRVVETRSLAASERALEESPSALAAIEITAANLEPALGLVERVAWRFPRAGVVAMVSDEASRAEPLLREAGAIDVLASTCEAPRAVRLARRQAVLAPARQLNIHEWVERQMPWAAYASRGEA